MNEKDLIPASADVIMALVDRELKLHDLVTRADLSERTARYVLDRAGLIGVPAGGGRGNHRVFTAEVAVRFALCTLLVTYGVPIEKAVDATLWCERRVKLMTRAEKDRLSIYESTASDPWLVNVIHGKYIRIWRETDHETMDDEEAYSLEERKKIRLVDVPSILHSAEINMTLLEGMILKD